MKRRAALLCAVVLTGCASEALRLESTLPSAPATRVSYVGVETPVLAPDAVEAAIAALQEDLRARLHEDDLKAALQALPEDALGVGLSADASFEAGSAQLRPAALEDYAALADLLATRGAVVVHVLVLGAADGGGPTGLAARRAASVKSYFQDRGVPATRIRAEGREAAGARVEIVLKPVVRGREAEAWMPPA